MFYVYVVGGKFVTIKENKKGDRFFSIGLTTSTEKCAYFTSKKDAKSWESSIKYRHRNAELKEAVLTLRETTN
jgi:hypothetical protein